jgi:hypothetical protein
MRSGKATRPIRLEFCCCLALVAAGGNTDGGLEASGGADCSVDAPADRDTSSVGSYWVTVRPAPSSEILINPGKGWVIYAPFERLSTLPAGALSAAAVCYNRYDWAAIEPMSDDNYQWQAIDEAIDACAAHGLKVAFGIMPANSCTVAPEVTPEWVFAAGATYTTYPNDCSSNTFTIKAPVWNDPVYKQKMQDLIDDLKARYDNHPDIAFVDNRTCGNWGEWHSLGCTSLSDYDKAVLVGMFAGWTTPVIIPNNGDSAQQQVTEGINLYQHGCRRDSSEYHQSGCADAYDESIAVSEWSTSYSVLKAGGPCWYGPCSWSPDLIPSYMSKSRFSYDNMGQWWDDTALFYNDNTALVHEWANRMGYWFTITEATYPGDLGNGLDAMLTFAVRNDGVAPIYVNRQAGGRTYVKLALLDDNDAVLESTTLAGLDPFNWKPHDESGRVYTESADFAFAYHPGGTKLAIGLFTATMRANPDIKLGNAARTSQGWYVLRGE